MAWLPLSLNRLQIGLFIRLDHHWMQHPFVRNSFMISSPSEIGIIKKHQLTKISYDPDRSSRDAVKALETEKAESKGMEDDALQTAIDEDEKILQSDKHRLVQSIDNHLKAMQQIEQAFHVLSEECSEMQAMTNAGDSKGVESANRIIDSMRPLLNEPAVAVSMISTAGPADPSHAQAADSLNVSALALLTGDTIKLNPQQSRSLGLGGLLHNIGRLRISDHIWSKRETLSEVERRELQQYPEHGRAMLSAIPGASSDIIQIVHQHRERLDGSGYPQGLVNGKIGFLARVIGAVTEYQALTSKDSGTNCLSPAQALSQLYMKAKNTYGLDAIEPFIATVTVYPPGSFVELNDGNIGVVVKVNQQARVRPIVMLCEQGDPVVVDLMHERSISIVKSLSRSVIDPQTAECLSVHRLSDVLAQ